MIMQWKRRTDNEYVAHWQGTTFTLAQDRTSGRWHLWANDKLVRENWSKSRQAMETIESRQQKLVLGAMQAGGPVANVRGSNALASARRSVAHAA